MPPSVSITLFEKVTYLRGQSASNDARGGFRNRRNVLDQDAQPSQLRGLVTVHLPKPTRIKSVELTLTGLGRTDWPEGIGNNRVELAETTHFFKEQIILFDAKAEAAPAPPLRRSHSVGPGIGLTDDVDWGMMAGGSHSANPNNCPDDRALTKAFQTKSKASGKSDKDAATQFARSAGKFAAKAGTAILPPTLLREIAASRPDKQASGASSSKKPANRQQQQQQQPQQPRSHPVSPVHTRFPPQHQPDPPPPVYVATPPADSTLSPPDGTGYFNLRRPASSSPSTPSPLHSPQLGPPPLSPALPPQSISAAGPHGRSILQTPRRNRTLPQQEQQSIQPSESPTTVIAADLNAASPDTTIQSGLRAQPASVNMVRFDSGGPTVNALPPLTPTTPGSVAPLPAESSQPPPVQVPAQGRRRGSSTSNVELEEPRIANPPPVASSAPASRRPSVDFSPTYPTLHGGKASNKGKGKAQTGQPHKLPGLKDILGGLRRDEGNSKNTKDGVNHKPSLASLGKSHKGSGPLSPVRGRRSTDASSAAPSAPGSTLSPSSGVQSSTTATPHVAPQYRQASQTDWREFKKGTYTYSISLPLPANLPPTLHADFGRNTYTLRANVRRSGPLTSNLTCEREVVLVHAPDEEGTEETEAVVVERTWEDALTYRVFVSGRSFACGSTIPLWMKFIPLGEKIKFWRVTVTLEERTHYYAKARKVSRHETPRRTVLLKIIDPDGKPLLPIFSDSQDALASSQLGQYAIAAAGLNVPPEMRNRAARRGESSGSTSQTDANQADDDDGEEGEEVRQDALATLLDPSGPWELAANLQLPGKDSRVNISTDHEKSCITVSHSLRMVFRVERIVSGAPKLFDIVIEAPIKINHSHTAEAWLSLPNYWSVASSSTPLDSGGGGGGGDYFSGNHHGGCSQPSSSSSRTPSWYHPSMAPGTPGGQIHPSRGAGTSSGVATPVNITPGPSNSTSLATSAAAVGGYPSSWGGQTTLGSGAIRDRFQRTSPSPPMPVTSPATSPQATQPATTQSTADQWLALSIARNESAGRTDRMVTFADGAQELPPPYSVDDRRAADGAETATSNDNTLGRL